VVAFAPSPFSEVLLNKRKEISPTSNHFMPLFYILGQKNMENGNLLAKDDLLETAQLAHRG
jgi:hypothetical protein